MREPNAKPARLSHDPLYMTSLRAFTEKGERAGRLNGGKLSRELVTVHNERAKKVVEF